jgi:hypothetical protein
MTTRASPPNANAPEARTRPERSARLTQASVRVLDGGAEAITAAIVQTHARDPGRYRVVVAAAVALARITGFRRIGRAFARREADGEARHARATAVLGTRAGVCRHRGVVVAGLVLAECATGIRPLAARDRSIVIRTAPVARAATAARSTVTTRSTVAGLRSRAAAVSGGRRPSGTRTVSIAAGTTARSLTSFARLALVRFFARDRSRVVVRAAVGCRLCSAAAARTTQRERHQHDPASNAYESTN